MTKKQISIAATSSAGFSMIDVLVAIVVLATALLALAALQGALTRNSADARSRSQIAAYSEGLIDQLRSGGYTGITAGTTTISPVCTSSATKQQAEACAAQTAAGISNLKTQITDTTYYADSSGAFSTTVPSSVTGRYDQVRVVTTWTDASGQSRQFAADTVISPIQVDQNNNALASTTLLPALGSTPIVRQYNPGLTDGVIPIAMGSTGSNTAATNPQPEILGKNNNQFIGGVSYNILTFGADDGTSNHETQITQNIATRVIRCSCKYGAGISTGVFAQPYRPTYWDASQKKYVTPSKTTSGTSDTGEDSSATQDTNCDICCRDRNDYGTSGEVRFNPWDTSDNSHYRYVTSSDTVPTVVDSSDNTDAYVNACRLIIVDGVFRVATDLHNYFFGLVGTDTASATGVPTGSTSTNTASSPLPTDAYKTDYQNFVIDYLTDISGKTAIDTATTLTTSNYPLNASSSPSSGNDAATLYSDNGLSSGGKSIPANIDISYVDPGKNQTAACLPTGTQDCRYLHARGLYVDYLEPVTLTAINNALSTCPSSSSSDIENCLLPLLPFTTINLTQLVDWSEKQYSGNVDITVSNTALTGGDPDQPVRGVASPLSTGKNNTTEDAVGTIGLSNSGIIGTLSQPGISPTDAANNLQASQQFTYSGGSSGSSSTLDFNIVLSGGAISTGTNIPSVGWAGLSAYYTSGSAVTTKPCSSGSSPSVSITYVGSTTNNCNSQTANQVQANGLPTGSTAGLQVTVQNYNVQTTGVGGTGTNCSTKIKGVDTAATGTVCSVYMVSGVSVNSSPITGWTSSAAKGSSGTSVYGLTAITTVTVPSGLSSTSSTTPDSLQITFAADATNSYTPDASGNPGGTGYSCTVSSNGKYTYTAYNCGN